MRQLFAAALLTFSFFFSFSQESKVKAKKYPSLLWEITGKGLSKPSYLFGTMHVSNKMAFHLSDSFYLAIKSADVVALETNPESWQEDMSKYDMGQEAYLRRANDGYPSDYLTINTLKFLPYEKLISLGLHSNPSMINSFLYRSYEMASDFEEDTYLDLYIFQVGRKWKKKVLGVENFDESMRLMKEAYSDAAKEKNNKRRSFDYDEDFSTAKLQEAYRTGNLDLLDTINKVNSYSAAFDEKFMYKRNEIQAASIDSILKSKQTLFVGVGAAHLPGQRGVIEMLRRMGYKLRPIKMGERDSHHKDEVDKVRVPATFTKTTSADSMFSVSLPGQLYSFMPDMGLVAQQQYADMANGSYYVVTRLQTNAGMWGHNSDVVYKKVDSLLYENIPGKLLSKKEITRNGYKGFDVTNRTRRGDHQRYNIFVTPYEIIIFKMSGNADYVKDAKEADQFFNSIELRPYKKEWKVYSPLAGGFEVEMPHQPVEIKAANWQFSSYDKETETVYNVLRSDIHNYQFVEEDSFDLNLMEESFASSDFIDKQISQKKALYKGYPSLDAKYKHKDGSVSVVKFLIKGPHYYTVMANSKKEHPAINKFINSFAITPFNYSKAEKYTDTSLYFTVSSPLPLEKKKKMEMNPGSSYDDVEEDSLIENGLVRSRLVQSDSTGEKIYVSFSKEGRYYYDTDTTAFGDTTNSTDKWSKEWVFHKHSLTELPNKTKVWDYVTGSKNSSRAFWIKYFYKDGVYTSLTTQIDTISAPSAFVTQFYKSFQPADTVKGIDPRSKKTGVWFADFFGKDTLLRKKAVYNIAAVVMDSTDFPQMKKAIQSLTWKEKKYLDTKNSFIVKLGFMPTKASADYLKDIYYAAGDTLQFQYTALSSLLRHKNAYAYNTFKDILLNEPPVLNVEDYSNSTSDVIMATDTTAYDTESYSSSFMDNLYDSTKLTATIFKDILPLINVEDYEWSVMYLMAELIDSNLLQPKDYEMYFSKFLIEAKQAWKKQQISEKNKAINKAQVDEEEEKNVAYNDYYTPKITKDGGNNLLSFYARLLIPFWDQNPAVPQLLNQFLNSSDKQLKYNTALLLLKNKKPVSDTLLKYYAGLDEYRFDLYSDLEAYDLQKLYPISKFNMVELAKSKLLSQNSGYSQPDTLVFADKLPFQYKCRNGFVYFFKYKSRKDDAAWKIATVGLVPADGKAFEFEVKDDEYVNLDFTSLTDTKLTKEKTEKEQFQKELKKLLYEKRKSAAYFYSDKEYNFMDAMLGERF